MSEDFKTSAEPRAMIGDVPVFCAYDELVPLEKIIPNPQNPNGHPPEQIALLSKIIKAQGWRAPITVSTRSGFIVRGHGRLMAARSMQAEAAPVDYQNYASEAEEYADLVADNRLSELSEIDDDKLADILQEIDTGEFDMALTGYTDEEIQDILGISESAESQREAAKSVLCERFIIPPFSILDGRTGEWMQRKKAWKNLGIQSDIGRGTDGDKTEQGLTYAVSCQPPEVMEEKGKYEREIGRKVSWDEFAKMFPEKIKLGGTSIFDPVVCELFYRWFCPAGGKIIDPFAGGSVRGIVAALTGRNYTGLDLSARQIEANRANWEAMDKEIIVAAPDKVGTQAPQPEWINADSRTIDTAASGSYDLMFTCPPYADLEVYSDDPRDISNMEYPEFLEIYREIIKKTAAKLKPNSFAVIVVGEVRGKDGNYYNFVGDTITAFLDAGLKYYNENILINSYASAAMRATKQFNGSRKNAKVHQNILMFSKGDADEAIESIAAFLEEGGTHGQMTQNHEQILVFTNGDPKEATKNLPIIEEEEDNLLQFEEGGLYDAEYEE
ncbi:MAG: ParB N-terminal domain-containing protein [Oscillospiraceae bacterium]|nr:ParB N-terminal domain-containing protein [Oscillospiraceae bacterium]